MSVFLGTAFTEGYPWGEAYVESLAEHCNVQWDVFTVGWMPAPGIFVAWEAKGGNWTRMAKPGTRGEMVQHGAMLAYWDTEQQDVLVFTDADMLMQRPLNEQELAWLKRLGPGQVTCAQNLYKGQTLADEAALIAPKVGTPELDLIFPGWDNIRVWNCGVLAMRRSTYERFYDFARALLPALESSFGGYSAIQWLLCYIMGRWFEHVEMPRTMHVHGHVDPGTEVSFDAEGNALVDGKLAVWRHALNLRPRKNFTSEGFH